LTGRVAGSPFRFDLETTTMLSRATTLACYVMLSRLGRRAEMATKKKTDGAKADDPADRLDEAITSNPADADIAATTGGRGRAADWTALGAGAAGAGGKAVSREERRRQSAGVARITDSVPGIATSLDICARARDLEVLCGRAVVCEAVRQEDGHTIMVFRVGQD